MNSTLETYARTQIKLNLAQLPKGWQLKFKQMYSHKDLDKDIDQVVDDMPTVKLDWALTQTTNSLIALNLNKPKK